MATYYVRNSGDDSRTGLSWANARQSVYLTLNNLHLKPGDTIYVAHDTYEDFFPGWLSEDALAPYWDAQQNDPPSWEGNEDDFVRIISVDDAGDPEPPSPSAWSAGATISGRSGFGWILSGPVYMWGLTIESQDRLWFTPQHMVQPTLAYTLAKCPIQPFVAENCTFRIATSALSPCYMRFANWEQYYFASPELMQQDYFFKDCTLHLEDAASHVLFYHHANVRFENCTLTCNASLDSDPFIVRSYANVEFYGCDLSSCPSSKYLVGYAPLVSEAVYSDDHHDAWSEVGACHVLINRCKLPSSFMGCFRPADATYPYSGDDHLRGEMYYSANSGTPDTRIFQWSSLRGTAFGESTVSRTGGADNGTGGYCIKVVTPGSGKAAPGPYFPFCLKPIRFYCFETGTKTFTFELVYDNATKDLTDRDVWVELLHMGSAVPGTVTRSLPHQLSGATLLPDGVGTANWTTTGLTQPKSQKVSVTATIDHEQVLEFQIKVGKAGRTIYLDPLVGVTG